MVDDCSPKLGELFFQFGQGFFCPFPAAAGEEIHGNVFLLRPGVKRHVRFRQQPESRCATGIEFVEPLPENGEVPDLQRFGPHFIPCFLRVQLFGKQIKNHIEYHVVCVRHARTCARLG